MKKNNLYLVLSLFILFLGAILVRVSLIETMATRKTGTVRVGNVLPIYFEQIQIALHPTWLTLAGLAILVIGVIFFMVRISIMRKRIS